MCGTYRPQSPNESPDAPILEKEVTQRVQSITKTFLFYERCVDFCILPALNEISSEQNNPTTATIPKNDVLMGYLRTNTEGM